ncbi:right-handed parallel beta-helix repeat-containing protein [Lacibacter luteus]|uniref:Right-handed parallel beta-helix repeat-containing protein n=1 Tax=Lacibacter luteus TaxID=2508719 RepID=A0A4Q1CFK5_9BACT|nr:T9SS type A sorting domain-containing protein [Lacibacter luteus]RXK58739.1 right-handed parallel beta-helix repeat-containing protein [Lacibacter luteus]
MKTIFKYVCIIAFVFGVETNAYSAIFVVSNTGDSGAGSLRQAITDANAAAGTDVIQFAILDIISNYFEGSTGARFAVIRLQTALPVITEAVTIDGSTQPNTNTATLAGKTVGRLAVVQNSIPYPDVYIVPNDVSPAFSFPSNGNGYLGNGLTINATNVIIKNIAISGFGNNDVSSQSAAISHGDISVVKVAAVRTANIEIYDCFISCSPTGTYPSITARRTKGSGILVCGNNYTGIIRNNLLSFCGVYGIVFNGVNNNANGVTSDVRPFRYWQVYENQVISPTMRTSTFTSIGAAGDGISLMNCYRMSVYNNWIENCEQFGIDQGHNTDSNYVNNNTITGAIITGGTSPVGGCRISFSSRADTLINNLIYNNTASNFLGGVYLDEQGTSVAGASTYDNLNHVIYQNHIYGNTGSGVTLSTSGSRNLTGNKISENLIYDNTGLGIDLGYGSSVSVTVNDNGDSDSGPNNLLNFPVIDSVKKTPTTIIIYGKVASGAYLEFFFTDGGTNQHGGRLYNYGEAEYYIGSGTEGSGSDLRTTTSLSYNTDGNVASSNVNGFAFSFAMASLPSGISPFVTATATVSNNTSEFGPMLNTAMLLDDEILLFSGKKRNTASELTWEVSSNTAISSFEIEYSTDGVHFSNAAVVQYNANSQQEIQNYHKLMSNVLPGNNYYRLKTVYHNGSSVYSKIVLLNFSGITSAVKAGPNPFTNKINIAFQETGNSTEYKMRLIDVAGKLVNSTTYKSNTGFNRFTWNINNLKNNSIYIVEMISETGEKFQQQLLHQ